MKDNVGIEGLVAALAALSMLESVGKRPNAGEKAEPQKRAAADFDAFMERLKKSLGPDVELEVRELKLGKDRPVGPSVTKIEAAEQAEAHRQLLEAVLEFGSVGGGHVYPFTIENSEGFHHCQGMNLRAYLAGQALAGAVTKFATPEGAASFAVSTATILVKRLAEADQDERDKQATEANADRADKKPKAAE